MSTMRESAHLTVELCRRHYLDGWSKKRIAEHFGISRFQVARMLHKAHQNGWVRIDITAPAELDTELGDELREVFDLRHVRARRGDGAAGGSRAEIAASAAQLLEDTLNADNVLGLAWSRTVAAAVDRLAHAPKIPVVQLIGALPQADRDGGSIELIRRFASLSGGAAYLYGAPMIFPDENTAETLRRQPEVARTIELTSTINIAVVAIGAWHTGASTVYDALPPPQRAEADRLHIVGEISGVFVDSDGHTPELDLSRRMMCPSASQLAQIDQVIAVVSGPGRADAALAALRTGLITSLVLGAREARELLDRASA